MTLSQDRLFAALEDFFVRCVGLSESESVDVLVELDLSISQAKTLFVLAHAPEPLPINALAERIRLSVAAAGRNVDSLVRAGLLARTESPVDRRVKLVSLTAAGREVTDQHVDAKRGAMRALVESLEPADADRLTDALQPLLDSVPRPPDPHPVPA